MDARKGQNPPWRSLVHDRRPQNGASPNKNATATEADEALGCTDSLQCAGIHASFVALHHDERSQ